MKKSILALILIAFAAVVPAIAASDNSAKISGPDCAKAWKKSAKALSGKEVSTYIADIKEFGQVADNAPFAVLEIETADSKNRQGGKILAIVPGAQAQSFYESFLPKIEKGQSPFGGKAQLKKVTGTFAVHAGEPVLLVNLSPEMITSLKKKASAVLAKQLADDPANAVGESSKEGYTKKVFNVSRLETDKTAKSEFNKIVALYNKGKKKNEQYKPDQIRELLEDGGDPITAFDDAKKIEWEIRK